MLSNIKEGYRTIIASEKSGLPTIFCAITNKKRLLEVLLDHKDTYGLPHL